MTLPSGRSPSDDLRKGTIEQFSPDLPISERFLLEQLSSKQLGAVRRKGFSVVWALELWERFGYYGMQAVLVLFMVEHLHLSDSDANLMQGAFAMLAYSLPVVGGVMGDYLLGTRPTLVAGAVGLTAGYGLLAFSLTHPTLFLPALALIALSNGLFKPNAGTLVRRIYQDDETALDAAFTLYYMSINVGSTFSMLLMPWLQLRFGPAIAFVGCALGLIVGLGYYLWRLPWLAPFFIEETPPKQTEDLSTNEEIQAGLLSGSRNSPLMMGLLCAVLLVLFALSVGMLAVPSVARTCVIVASAGLFVLWGVLYKKAALFERAGLLLSYILCLQTMAYQIFYQQMQTSLTLFALRAVSGAYKIGPFTLFHMSAGQFQALNPIWIMIFSPFLAWLYHRWAKRGVGAALPVKLLCGYVCISLAFLLWWLSARWATGLVSPWIMVLGYGTMSLGELLTIGLGLAIIARYAPVRISALLMGTLYLLWGVGMYSGSLVANMAALPAAPDLAASGLTDRLVRPDFYAPLFRSLFIAALMLCGLLLALLPVVGRLSRQHSSNMARIAQG